MIKMEVYKLDRIEEGIAAVENTDGAMLFVSASRLPENAKDGAETEFRKKVIKGLLDDLINKK